MAEERIVTRMRILFYRGPESWVKATTENKNRFVNGLKIVTRDLNSGSEKLEIREELYEVKEVKEYGA